MAILQGFDLISSLLFNLTSLSIDLRSRFVPELILGWRRRRRKYACSCVCICAAATAPFFSVAFFNKASSVHVVTRLLEALSLLNFFFETVPEHVFH